MPLTCFVEILLGMKIAEFVLPPGPANFKSTAVNIVRCMSGSPALALGWGGGGAIA